MLSWFSSLRAIVEPFIQICLLRQGPQDLPTSGILLGIALTAHAIMSILLSTVFLGASSALFSGLLHTLLLVVLTGALLYLLRRQARVIQTLTALAGAGAVITVVELPISGWLHGADRAAGEGAFALLLLIFLTIWSVAVAGHIFRHALSVPFFLGLVLAVAFYLVSISVFRALFPVGA